MSNKIVHTSLASTACPATDDYGYVKSDFSERSPAENNFQQLKLAQQTSEFGDSNLTYVASVETQQSLLPPPRVITRETPPTLSWLGDAYGKTITHEIPVPLEEEKIVYKPVTRTIERPVEVIRTVKKPVVKQVVEFRQKITDEVIEVPKPYPVETEVFVPRYLDQETACAVAQTYRPNFTFRGAKDVECVRYEPDVRIVDVKVPRIVNGGVVLEIGKTEHKVLPRMSKAQWNTLVLKINPSSLP